MRRGVDREQTIGFVENVRKHVPDIAFRTTFIVGFPGETDQTFNESCDFAREIGFSHIHTFKYSVRTGTKAASMPDQVPEKVKSERSEVMRQISLENKTKYFEMMQGRSQRMLVERIDSRGIARGYGENYLPIVAEGKDLERNTFINIRLGEIIHRENEDKMAYKTL
jgi:threonylcarbamoyladenosine tRNA methylthiotransferase MtaB